jgi:hypothetical protein
MDDYELFSFSFYKERQKDLIESKAGSIKIEGLTKEVLIRVLENIMNNTEGRSVEGKDLINSFESLELALESIKPFDKNKILAAARNIKATNFETSLREDGMTGDIDAYNEVSSELEILSQSVQKENRRKSLNIKTLNDFFSLSEKYSSLFDDDTTGRNANGLGTIGDTLRNKCEEIESITSIPGHCLRLEMNSRGQEKQFIFLGQTSNGKVIAIKLLLKDLKNLAAYRGYWEHRLEREMSPTEFYAKPAKPTSSNFGDLFREKIGIPPDKKKKVDNSYKNYSREDTEKGNRHIGQLTQEIMGKSEDYPLGYFDTGHPPDLETVENFVRYICAKRNS